MASGKITIKREQLDNYAELLRRKAALDTELSALKEAICQFEAAVLEQMNAAGKSTAKRLGWTFAVARGNKSVAWKSEFIRVAGADAATQLALAAKGQGKTDVSITPPSTSQNHE